MKLIIGMILILLCINVVSADVIYENGQPVNINVTSIGDIQYVNGLAMPSFNDVKNIVIYSKGKINLTMEDVRKGKTIESVEASQPIDIIDIISNTGSDIINVIDDTSSNIIDSANSLISNSESQILSITNSNPNNEQPVNLTNDTFIMDITTEPTIDITTEPTIDITTEPTIEVTESMNITNSS